MTNLAHIDPFIYGYFSDETLEHGERVGLAFSMPQKILKSGFLVNYSPKHHLKQNTAVRATHHLTDFGFPMKTF